MHLVNHTDLTCSAFTASLAALLTLATLPARAEFDDPVNVSPAGTHAAAPQVAMDADADALVVWLTADRIKGRGRSADGGYGPVKDFSLPSGQFRTQAPQIAMNAAGNALVVWSRDDGTHFRIQARERSAAGQLGRIVTLSSAGQHAYEPKVAMTSAGDALVVWHSFDGTNIRVYFRARSAAGELGKIQILSAPGQNADLPGIAMDAAGNALVVWKRYDGARDRIQARARSAAGDFGPVVTLSRAEHHAYDPEVAMTGAGDALVAWRAYDGTYYRLQARSRSAAGVLGAIQTLSAASGDAANHRLALSAGDGIVVWEFDNGSISRIQARARSAAGVLGAMRYVSPAGRDATLPRLAMDGGGKAVIGWRGLSGGGTPVMQARTRSAAGAFGPVQNLSAAATQHPFNATPQVAVDAAGDALAVWIGADAAGTNRVQAAAGP
jgi:hypothetical protein